MSTMRDVWQTSAPRTAFFPRFPLEEPPSALSRLLAWLDRQAQRARLAQLENWQHDDIGISRTEAVMESRRWD